MELKLKKAFWILLLIPYFQPAIFSVMEETAILDQIYDLWRLGAAAVVVLLYVYRMLRYKKRPSGFILWLWGYLFFVGVSSVLQAENYWNVLNHTVTIATFCMLVELSLREGPEVTLDMLFYPLTVLILANFVLMCLYPGGICTGGTYNYSYNFLGIDNFLAPILIPYMFITALRSTMLYGELDFTAYAMIVVCGISILLVWAATGMMGLAVALVFLLFFYQRRFQTLFNGLTSMLAGFGLFFGVVLFRLQNLFAFLIEGVLHKGLSFTGRTEIWDEAVRMFLKQPWLGYGYAQYGKIYRLRKGKYYHGHNIFLEIAVEGGVLGLGCFLMMLASSAGQLLRHRKHPYACLISAGIMSVAVMTTMEPYHDSNGLLIYGLLVLGYHVGTLINGKETEPVGAAKKLTAPQDKNTEETN